LDVFISREVGLIVNRVPCSSARSLPPSSCGSLSPRVVVAPRQRKLEPLKRDHGLRVEELACAHLRDRLVDWHADDANVLAFALDAGSIRGVGAQGNPAAEDVNEPPGLRYTVAMGSSASTE
jgi:hypothetical protein